MEHSKNDGWNQALYLDEIEREPSPEQSAWSALTNLERSYVLKLEGWTSAESEKARRPRQSSDQIAETVAVAEAALEAVTAAEIKAGPAAMARINEAKRFQAAHGIGIERTNAVRQLLGQRNGLLRVLTLKERRDFITTVNDRVLAFLDVLMDLSANAAALSGSTWKSTATWLGRNFSFVYDDLHDLARDAFEAKRAASAIAIAARVTVNRYDLRTAPSVTEIAARFEITALELRIAKARSGLTSIDRVDEKTADRNRITAKRRAAGIKPQSERNVRAEDIRLASLAGCTDRAIRNHRRKGDLDVWLASRGVSFPKVSVPKDHCVPTHLGTAPETSETLAISEACVFPGDAWRALDAAPEINPETASFEFGEEIPVEPVGALSEHDAAGPAQHEEGRSIPAAFSGERV